MQSFSFGVENVSNPKGETEKCEEKVEKTYFPWQKFVGEHQSN
jgi:hypothetical protein